MGKREWIESYQAGATFVTGGFGLGVGAVSLREEYPLMALALGVAALVFSVPGLFVISRRALDDWSGWRRGRKGRQLRPAAIAPARELSSVPHWPGLFGTLHNELRSVATVLNLVVGRLPKSNTRQQATDAGDALFDALDRLRLAVERAPDAVTAENRMIEAYTCYDAYVDAVHWLARDVGQSEQMATWKEYLDWRQLDGVVNRRLQEEIDQFLEVQSLSQTIKRVGWTSRHHVR